METTRHFVTTVFVVHGNKTALHEHKKLELMLAPGGHIDRDELPHEAAEREVLEETGLDVSIDGRDQGIGSYEWSSEIPAPDHVALDDITVKDGEPVHQHINLVYFAEVDTKSISPEGHDEVGEEGWYWLDREELKNTKDLPFEIDGMTRELGVKAIDRFN